MSVNSKMTALADAIRIKTGRTDTLTLDEMTTAVDGIEEGIDTSDATATSGDILAGKTAYIANDKVTGTFTIEDELTEQSDLISRITNLVATKAVPSTKTPETCTVTFESTNSAYTQILFIQYAALDESGNVVGKTLLRSSITTSFSIQCVCNTCLAGIFPPTNISGVGLSSNITQNLSANSSNGAFFWGTLTAAPGENVIITFS